MANLLAATDIGTLLLDTGLRIQRFTPSATRIVRLIATGAGRPLGDIAHNLSDERLVDEARPRASTPRTRSASCAPPGSHRAPIHASP